MRWCIAFLAAACPLLGASWEQKVERAAKLVQARAAAESPFLAADTYLRTAELVRATRPALARECSLAAVDLLKKVEEPTPNEMRAMRLLMSLDPVEGERVVLEPPGKASAYIAVIDYWLGQDEPGRAGERLRQAWRNGVWFRSPEGESCHAQLLGNLVRAVQVGVADPRQAAKRVEGQGTGHRRHQ